MPDEFDVIDETSLDSWEGSIWDDGFCPCCVADQAVAPFVGWLLNADTTLELRLAGQALCINALEQLDCPRIENAPWRILDMRRCLVRTFLQCIDDEIDEIVSLLKHAAKKLAAFLRHHGLIDYTTYLRLRRQAKHLTLPPQQC